MSTPRLYLNSPSVYKCDMTSPMVRCLCLILLMKVPLPWILYNKPSWTSDPIASRTVLWLRPVLRAQFVLRRQLSPGLYSPLRIARRSNSLSFSFLYVWSKTTSSRWSWCNTCQLTFFGSLEKQLIIAKEESQDGKPGPFTTDKLPRLRAAEAASQCVSPNL